MTKINLGVGVALGLVATILMNMHIADIRKDSVSAAFLMLAPQSELVKGDKIEIKHLVRQELPSKFSSLSRLAIADSQNSRSWIIGRAVNSDIKGGSLLLHSHFLDDPEERFSAQISVGKRAFAMTANSASSVAFFIQPGSRIDVLGTFVVNRPFGSNEENNQQGIMNLEKRTETRSLLQNLKVLAVDRATTRKGYLDSANSGFSTVTLEVSPLEAETLVFAKNESRGPLTFVLRNPKDDSLSETPSVSWKLLSK